MIQFKVLKGSNGFALYSDGALVSTWGKKESHAYVLKQAKARMERSDTLLEDDFDGVFPSTLPKPKAPARGVVKDD